MNKDKKMIVMHLIVDEIVLNRVLVYPKDEKHYNQFGYKILKDGDPKIGHPYKGH